MGREAQSLPGARLEARYWHSSIGSRWPYYPCTAAEYQLRTHHFAVLLLTMVKGTPRRRGGRSMLEIVTHNLWSGLSSSRAAAIVLALAAAISCWHQPPVKNADLEKRMAIALQARTHTTTIFGFTCGPCSCCRPAAVVTTLTPHALSCAVLLGLGYAVAAEIPAPMPPRPGSPFTARGC